jgi:hypothetical protein
MSTESGFDAYIKRIMDENKEILEALGSDFDEEGIPYWEKWGKGEEDRFDAEYPIDKTQQ